MLAQTTFTAHVVSVMLAMRFIRALHADAFPHQHCSSTYTHTHKHSMANANAAHQNIAAKRTIANKPAQQTKPIKLNLPTGLYLLANITDH